MDFAETVQFGAILGGKTVQEIEERYGVTVLKLNGKDVQPSTTIPVGDKSEILFSATQEQSAKITPALHRSIRHFTRGDGMRVTLKPEVSIRQTEAPILFVASRTKKRSEIRACDIPPGLDAEDVALPEDDDE